jgi:transcriptional regulator with XRE-family HTH domain
MRSSPGDEDKIANAIRASGMPYRDIARKMGVSDASVSNYANRMRKPSRINLAQLARALGVDVRDLLRDGADDVV